MTPVEVNALIDGQIKDQGNQVRASILVEVLKSLVNGKVTVGGPDAFKATTAYQKDAIVEKDEKWYKFTKAHTGAWDEDDVEEVTLYELYVALEERVAALEA